MILRSLLYLILILNFCNLNALFDLSKIGSNNEKSKKTKITFTIDTIEAYKEKLKAEIEDKEKFESKFLKEERLIKEKLNNIAEELSKIDEKLKTSTEDEREYLLKYISLLNEKKQVLSSELEAKKETLSTIKENIKVIKLIIGTKEKPVTEKLSSSYSWKEFQEIAKELSAKMTKKNNELRKKQTLEEQKDTKEKFLDSNEKLKDSKKEQLNELEEKIEQGKRDKENIAQRSLLKEEISLLEEKSEQYKSAIKNLEEKIKLNTDQAKLLELEFELQNKNLKEIEKNILPTPEDVNLAQQEWNIESQKVQMAKEDWDKRKAPLKENIEKLTKELDSLTKQKKAIKEEEVNKVKSLLIDSEIQKLETIIEEKNKRLKVIDSEKERLDLRVDAQKLQYQIIKAYYQSSIDKSMIPDWLQKLNNQKSLSEIQIKELQRKLDEEVSAQPETLRKIEEIKLKKEDLNLKKVSIFKGNNKAYYDVFTNLNDTLYYLNSIQGLSLKNLTIISDQIKSVKQMINSYEFTIKQLEKKSVSENIWKRSPKAISFIDLSKSLEDAEMFFKKIFWDIPDYLSFSNFINFVKNLGWPDYLGLFIFIILFAIFLFGMKHLLLFLRKKINLKIEGSSQHYIQIYTTIDALLGFALDNFKLLFSWFFVYLHVLFDFKYVFSSISFIVNPFMISTFYLISIPIWLYLSSTLLSTAKELNKKLSYLFFAEKTQSKFMFLLTAILYSTSILIPLRQAFLNYMDIPSVFPSLMLAAYSLILVVIVLLFFGKDDVLALLPPKGTFFIWIRKKIEKYYYPVFIFFMGLLILSNPYVGYSNLAWYLIFAVPGTVLIFYGLFFIHFYIRKYSVSFFLKEENDEIVDKFEQAKVYYGFFTIITFLVLSFFSFVLITRIWQFNYTPSDLWRDLSQDWVIKIGDGANLGIVEFLIFISFILAGFLISSLLKKFVFNKLFDIFRTEPGAQNTMFRIAHYIIIALSLILGFAAIQLKDFIFWVGGFLAVGIGFALKDLAADYVSGLFILIERPFEIGNFIQLDDKTIGSVQKISARATTIKTARNFSVIVPNKDLVSKQLVNWGHGRMSVGFELRILVDYGQDFEFIKEVLLKTVDAHEATLKVPSVVVRLESFEDNGVLFLVRCFISSRKIKELWQISSEVRFAMIKAFRENNITIAYPQVVVHTPVYSKEKRGLKALKGIQVKFDEDSKENKQVKENNIQEKENKNMEER
ncbi:mechanosensitive ion channel [Candidatus Dependentiae bacterium]|nr:mechanosensitive ion channel [Candidatus Dependentiae bacterium]